MPWKKMARNHLWIFLFCLQTCVEAAESKTGINTVNGILGEPVTFPLSLQKSQEVTSIAWMNSKSSVALVIVPDSEAPLQVTVTHQNYYERINVSHQNYNLEISNLRMEDAGLYKADINVKTPKKSTITKIYNLKVYRRLERPKITQSLMASVNNTCNVTLTCSVEKEEKNVTYSWSPVGKEGSVLQIFQVPNNQELTFTCIAQNPVSNNSDSISAQQLCTDIKMGFHTRHAGLLYGLVAPLLFIFILSPVLLFLLWKRGQGSLKTFNKKPDAMPKNTIYTCAMISRNAQPAEPRIYDEILPSKVLPTKEKAENTVYSTVQYFDKM